MLLRKKRKILTVYFVVILFSFSLIGFLLFNGKIRTEPKLISDWDNDFEDWIMFGGDFATTSSDHTTFYEGKGSLRIKYDWDDKTQKGDWFSVVKVFVTPQDFTPYYGINFWVKGDGSDTRYRVMLHEKDGEFWMTSNSYEELFPLESKEWQFVNIPFSTLKHDAFTPIVDNFLDLTQINDIGLIFWDGTTQTGSIYFDEIKLTPTLLPITGNNLLLYGAVLTIPIATVLVFEPEIKKWRYARRKESESLSKEFSVIETKIPNFSSYSNLFEIKEVRDVQKTIERNLFSIKVLLQFGMHKRVKNSLFLLRSSLDESLRYTCHKIATTTEDKMGSNERFNQILVKSSKTSFETEIDQAKTIFKQATKLVEKGEYDTALHHFNSIESLLKGPEQFLLHLATEVEYELENIVTCLEKAKTLNISYPLEQIVKMNGNLERGRTFIDNDYIRAYKVLSRVKKEAEILSGKCFSEAFLVTKEIVSHIEVDLKKKGILNFSYWLERSKNELRKSEQLVKSRKYGEAIDSLLFVKKIVTLPPRKVLKGDLSIIEGKISKIKMVSKQVQSFNMNLSPIKSLQETIVLSIKGRAYINEEKYEEAFKTLSLAKKRAESGLSELFSELSMQIENTHSEIANFLTQSQFVDTTSYEIQLENAKKKLSNSKICVEKKNYEDAVTLLLQAKTSAEVIPRKLLLGFYSKIKKISSKTRKYEKVQEYITFDFKGHLKETKEKLREGIELIDEAKHIAALRYLSSLNIVINNHVYTALSEFSSAVEIIISKIDELFAENRIRSISSPNVRLELAKTKLRNGIVSLKEDNYGIAFTHLFSAKKTAESLVSLPAQLLGYVRYEIFALRTIDNALIFSFLVSLIICAIIAIFNEGLANTILTYTFWLLVAGVIWKMVLLIKEERSK